jgi:hypothetical protein
MLDDTQSVFDHWISDERITDNRVSPSNKTILTSQQGTVRLVIPFDRIGGIRGMGPKHCRQSSNLPLYI